MADKPTDNKPATEHGEVKVIKNAEKPREENRAGRPGGTPEIQDPAVTIRPGKTPGKAEG